VFFIIKYHSKTIFLFLLTPWKIIKILSESIINHFKNIYFEHSKKATKWLVRHTHRCTHLQLITIKLHTIKGIVISKNITDVVPQNMTIIETELPNN